MKLVSQNDKEIKMQFYIIDDDPIVNATLLPQYARKVNIREGWQILSDVGHTVGVSFTGQTAKYSLSHPAVRRFTKDKASFTRLILHYQACLVEEKEYSRTWMDKFANATAGINEIKNRLPDTRSDELHTIDYLLNNKLENKNGKRQITEAEERLLRHILHLKQAPHL
jgi:hypothetical protein